MLLAVGIHGALQHLRSYSQAQVLRDRRTSFRQCIFGSLRLQGRILAAFEAFIFLLQPAILRSRLKDLVLQLFLAILMTPDFIAQ